MSFSLLFNLKNLEMCFHEKKDCSSASVLDEIYFLQDKQKMKKNLNVSFETPVSVQEYFHNRSPHLRYYILM